MPVIPKRGGLKSELGMPVPQVRVLQVLAAAKGPLTRQKITDRCGNKTPVMVGRAVGYSDPEKRKAFEQTTEGGGTPQSPCPSLLTRGYVQEVPLDIDGIEELAIRITDAGRKALDALGPLDLPAAPSLGLPSGATNTHLARKAKQEERTQE